MDDIVTEFSFEEVDAIDGDIGTRHIDGFNDVAVVSRQIRAGVDRVTPLNFRRESFEMQTINNVHSATEPRSAQAYTDEIFICFDLNVGP